MGDMMEHQWSYKNFQDPGRAETGGRALPVLLYSLGAREEKDQLLRLDRGRSPVPLRSNQGFRIDRRFPERILGQVGQRQDRRGRLQQQGPQVRSGQRERNRAGRNGHPPGHGLGARGYYRGSRRPLHPGLPSRTIANGESLVRDRSLPFLQSPRSHPFIKRKNRRRRVLPRSLCRC